MKSVLISIQPYWVFLIIARLMGWDTPQNKTVEVRKSYPRDSAWNKKTLIYCSKSMRSFKRIPVQYQPFMKKLLGKVIGEFVCDFFDEFTKGKGVKFKRFHALHETELSVKEMLEYMGDKGICYGWHISDLKIYDKPKELGEFYAPCPAEFADKYDCSADNKACKYFTEDDEGVFGCCREVITRPPQSWCYVEEV